MAKNKKNMNTQEIQTSLGIIDGRDAIILKNIETQIHPNCLICFLEIDSNSCSDCFLEKEFINSKIIFNKVLFYSFYSLDYCPFEKFIKSSFDKVLDSDFLQKYNVDDKFIHVILSCYDHIMEVVCEKYDFQIT